MKLIKTCPICHIQFETTDGNKGKTTCSRSCSNTYFKDQRHTKLSRQKRSTAGIARPHTLKKVSKPCPVCGDLIVGCPSFVKHRKTCGKRLCFSINHSVKLTGRTGGPRTGGGWGKQTKYAGVTWDSTWEARLAERLDKFQIKWIRPGKELSIQYVTFDGKHRNYYPDVFLPDSDTYIEVKGHWTPEARHKVEQGRLQRKRIIVLETLDEIEQFTGV